MTPRPLYPSDFRRRRACDPGPARRRIAALAEELGFIAGDTDDGPELPRGALAAVARHLGVSEGAVGQWWHGRAPMPAGRG